ncbi:MAG: serine/threonine-protein phosphatase, partial [Chlamydiia bacterium]|nr:serine/threonine-protein phosphatase [Chlamydiia bacterium]
DPDLRGMGTTLVCMLLHPEGVVLAHVGDSRAYRLQNGVLEQMTSDDTLAHQLIDQGHLDPEDEAFFAYKNVITKAIGNGEQLKPHVALIEPHDGDIFLLCTDGLTDMLSHGQIEMILNSGHSPDELAADLVATAKSLGGHDNVTALVVHLRK